MTIDVTNVFGETAEAYAAAMVAKGHTPYLRNGRIDTEFYDYEDNEEGRDHYGPGCSTCGLSWCWHCVRLGKIEPCKGTR